MYLEYTQYLSGSTLIKLKILVKQNSHILVRQANPEREAVRLGNELHMFTLLEVVDTCQVASTLTTLFQGLVPTQPSGHNLIS